MADQVTPRASGRPSSYSPELAEAFCEAIATSTIGIRRLCNERADFPDPQTIFTWLYKHPEFLDQYMRAKQSQQILMSEEVVEISDNAVDDLCVDDKGGQRPNSAAVQRSKLRVETRTWLMERLAPKVFKTPEKLEIKTTAEQLTEEELIALAKEYANGR